MQYGSKLVLDQRYIHIQLLASELGLICCLLPAMHAISGWDLVSSFSHIEKITAFQTLKRKIDELTDMIDFGELPSLSLERPSVVALIQYVCYLCEENKSGSNVSLLNCVPHFLKTCSGASVPCMLTCSGANVPCVLTCLRALRALRAYVLYVLSYTRTNVP